jgi:hypothetical protein
MNDEQYKRYRKIFSEDIKCLYMTHDKKKNIHFLVSGSSDKRYKVTISAVGRIACGCPDFVHNSKVQECVCKHCLYIIYSVLRFTDRIEHEFFKRRFFTKDEMVEIRRLYLANRKSATLVS